MTAEILENSSLLDAKVQITPDTMDAFLREIQKPAYRMAQLSTQNTEEALDLVQDALVKLLQNYSNKPIAELKPLFYSILSSKLIDWHRKRTFRSKFHWFFSERAEDGNMLENLASDSCMSTDELLANERDMVNLHAVLSELSERQRQVVLLRLWQGFSVKETAEILKCSPGSIKTHLHRAIQILRENYAQTTETNHDG